MDPQKITTGSSFMSNSFKQKTQSVEKSTGRDLVFMYAPVSHKDQKSLSAFDNQKDSRHTIASQPPLAPKRQRSGSAKDKKRSRSNSRKSSHSKMTENPLQYENSVMHNVPGINDAESKLYRDFD
jgi:hypothetical protein